VKIVCGLGNPGPKYAGNRHNAGFMVTTHLADRWGAPSFREKFKARLTKERFAGEDVVLLEPQTYMNLSGESLQKAMRFFKVELEDVVVVHDELDLGFGDLRIKIGGGLAGHNGLKSIAQCCGGNSFVRLRFGIGRPRSGAVEGYVLSDFGSEDRAELPDVVARAADMIETALEKGAKAAMNTHHGKAKK